MMRVEYDIINPAGNITALVVTPVDRERYKEICREILGRHKTVEQVGFVDYSKEILSLQMAGGEFCGNATISAAALYSKIYDKTGDFLIRVSGMSDTLQVSVEKKDEGLLCRCLIPCPERMDAVLAELGGRRIELPLVRLEGIAHLIAPPDLDRGAVEAFLRSYAKDNHLPALGIMFLDWETAELTPLVYVKDVDTLYYENSCASGSCAVCACLTAQEGRGVSLSLHQPGGVIHVSTLRGDGFVELSNMIDFEQHCIEDFLE